MLSRINYYNFIHWVDFLQIKLLLFTMVSSASSNAQFAIWVDVGMPPNLEMTETAKDILSFSLSNFLRENNIYYCSWLSINLIWQLKNFLKWFIEITFEHAAPQLIDLAVRLFLFFPFYLLLWTFPLMTLSFDESSS